MATTYNNPPSAGPSTSYPTTGPGASYPASAPAALRRISWAAVFGGVVIALVVQLMLTMLGTGIGMSTIDPGQGESPTAQSFGIGAGVWWIVSSLVSLFAGGYAAGRLAGVPRTEDSLLHGLLTWGVATLVSVYLIASAVGGVVSGAMSAVSGVASGAGKMVSAAAPALGDQISKQAEQAGFDVGDLRKEAMKLLDQTGKPALQPGAVQGRAQQAAGDVKATAQDAAQNPGASDAEIGSLFDRLFKEGKAVTSEADAEALANVVAARTGMTKQEALATVKKWGNQVEQAKAKFDQQAAKAKEKAREIADATAKNVSRASLFGFFALLLGAVAAGFGSIKGQPRGLIRT